MITLFTRSPQPEMLYGWYLFDRPQICLSFGRRLYFPSPSFFHVPSARQTLLSGVFALCQFNGVSCCIYGHRVYSRYLPAPATNIPLDVA